MRFGEFPVALLLLGTLLPANGFYTIHSPRLRSAIPSSQIVMHSGGRPARESNPCHGLPSDKAADMPKASSSETRSERGLLEQGITAWVARRAIGVLAAISVGSVAPPVSAWSRTESSESGTIENIRQHWPKFNKLLERDTAGAKRDTAGSKIGVVGLPAGWEEDIDPRSGRVFYINHKVSSQSKTKAE